MAVIEVEIPEIILENHPNLDEIRRELFENLVIEEYRKGNLTIRESAKLLGLTYRGFMVFLGERGISFCNASKEELEEDYRAFSRLLGQKK